MRYSFAGVGVYRRASQITAQASDRGASRLHAVIPGGRDPAAASIAQARCPEDPAER
jgi:hypothetical protein